MHGRVSRGAAPGAPQGVSRVDAALRGRTAVERRHPEIMRTAAASHHVNDAYVADLRAAYGIPDEEPEVVRRPPSLPAMPASTTTDVEPPRLGPPTRCSEQWHRGPTDPAGTLIELSDRPIMCAAVNASAGQAVVGSSDHASYVIDVVRGVKMKALFGKRVGHSEWVTSVTYLHDGSNKIVSCGMDGKIIVWDPITARTSVAVEPRCSVLEGHFGSISTVATPCAYDRADNECAFGHLILSTGYDKTVRLWDSRTLSELAQCKEHKAPVMIQSVQPQHTHSSRLCTATGDRDGVVKVWDMGAGVATATLTGHKGHITAARWLPPFGFSADCSVPATLPMHDQLLATGAQDGHLRIWDMRAKACAANIELHTTDKGAGALGDISVCTVPSGGGGYETVLVTAGADCCVCVIDPRKGFGPRHRFSTHKDFIYALTVHGQLAFSGDGSGMLIAHDIVEGKPLWGLGANEAAVRYIGVVGDSLIASGDDGKAILYNFAEGKS